MRGEVGQEGTRMTPRVLARIGAVVAAASCAVVSLTGGIA